MGAKIRKMIDHASELLELVVNVIIIIAVVVAILSLWKPFIAFVQNRESAHAFLDFLGYVLNVLIGIEFFKILIFRKIIFPLCCRIVIITDHHSCVISHSKIL